MATRRWWCLRCQHDVGAHVVFAFHKDTAGRKQAGARLSPRPLRQPRQWSTRRRRSREGTGEVSEYMCTDEEARFRSIYRKRMCGTESGVLDAADDFDQGDSSCASSPADEPSRERAPELAPVRGACVERGRRPSSSARGRESGRGVNRPCHMDASRVRVGVLRERVRDRRDRDARPSGRKIFVRRASSGRPSDLAFRRYVRRGSEKSRARFSCRNPHHA